MEWPSCSCQLHPFLVFPKFLEDSSAKQILLCSGVALFPANSSADLRQCRQRGSLAGRYHFGGFREVVPHEWFYVRLDDHVRLRAPCQIRVMLENIERAAENVCERARLLDVACLKIHRDDNVGAKKQCAFHGHRSGKESIDQCSSV